MVKKKKKKHTFLEHTYYGRSPCTLAKTHYVQKLHGTLNNFNFKQVKKENKQVTSMIITNCLHS